MQRTSVGEIGCVSRQTTGSTAPLVVAVEPGTSVTIDVGGGRALPYTAPADLAATATLEYADGATATSAVLVDDGSGAPLHVVPKVAPLAASAEVSAENLQYWFERGGLEDDSILFQLIGRSTYDAGMRPVRRRRDPPLLPPSPLSPPSPRRRRHRSLGTAAAPHPSR